MIQCRGVFLKRGMVVCHGRVTGIASLGKKAEIGQVELPDQLFVESFARSVTAAGRV